MKEAVTLAVVLAVIAAGGLWLLQDGSDDGAPIHPVTADYRPGPAWLHRRLGQTIVVAPLPALTNAAPETTLGLWTPQD